MTHAEVAALLRLAARTCDAADDQAFVQRLARDLAPRARNPCVWRSLLLRPSQAPLQAMAHLCLQALGETDEALDAMVRMALQSSAAAASPGMPCQLIGTAWIRHLAFGDAELLTPALAQTPLGAGVDLLQATVDEGHAFTRTLAHATDFGRVALPPTFDSAGLMDLADAVAMLALADDDLGLLAEVLMAPASLRQPWTPTLVFGWQVLELEWTDNGLEAGSSLAAGMTCAALLAADCLPPATGLGPLGATPPPAASGDAWREQWKRCTQAQHDGLGFMTLSLELRQALDNLDLARVHTLIRRAADHGWLDKPLVLQAAEMLGRMCAGSASD